MNGFDDALFSDVYITTSYHPDYIPQKHIEFFDTTTLLLPSDKIVNKYVQHYNHYQAG